ncbi:MAG: sugar phosphate isomerase/epimerase family protein [Geobacteraceae bacterium]|nr:sugar phosphate isomerase/epimerase family protein [Geobacteraceae bacterium]
MKTDRIHVHVPFALLREHLGFILERKINPEIAFSADSLDMPDIGMLKEISSLFSENSIMTTIHAPFMDLNPGALDRLVLEATRLRFRQIMEMAEIFRPSVVVFHPGYDRWRYGGNRDRWLRHAVDTFRPIVESADQIGCIAAVENIFEEDPSTLRALLDSIPSPFFRHCFDVGHWNLFSRIGMEEWFGELGSHIAETHIHDNSGTADDHLPIGEAGIDFPLFFRLMERYAPEAAWTIEAHSRDAVERALRNLEPYAMKRQSENSRPLFS